MRATICALGAALLLGCGPAPPPRIVVVEEHPLAWPVWEEARARGTIRAGATLLHLDAHEDAGEPEAAIPPGIDPAGARRLAEEELAVDEVLLPAFATGLLSRAIWTPPPWLSGAEATDPRVRVVRLEELAPIPGDVILDVDLDFFACENPHAAHLDRAISRAEYEELLASGRVRREGEAVEGEIATRSTVLARPPGPFTWPVRVDRIRDRGTGAERFVRGFVCLGEYRDAFPVHRPSDAEIEALAARVGEALRRARIRPGLVTVARSASSGFVPADRAEGIESRLLAALRER